MKMPNNRWLWVVGAILFTGVTVFGYAVYRAYQERKRFEFQSIRALEAEERRPIEVVVKYTAHDLDGAEIYINPIMVPNFSVWRTKLADGVGFMVMSVGDRRKISREGFEFGIIFPKDHANLIYKIPPGNSDRLSKPLKIVEVGGLLWIVLLGENEGRYTTPIPVERR